MNRKYPLKSPLGELAWRKFNRMDKEEPDSYILCEKYCKGRFKCLTKDSQHLKYYLCCFNPVEDLCQLEKIFIEKSSKFSMCSDNEFLFRVPDTNYYYIFKGSGNTNSVCISKFLKEAKIEGILSKMDMAVEIAQKVEVPIEKAFDIIKSIITTITEVSMNGESLILGELEMSILPQKR
ncbi:MAG: hypothetical protein WC614_04710 [bacterium]